MTAKFYTLSIRAGSAGPFNTRMEASNVLNKLIEVGYWGLNSSDIEEWLEPKDFRGMELLAEERNRLIDWVP